MCMCMYDRCVSQLKDGDTSVTDKHGVTNIIHTHTHACIRTRTHTHTHTRTYLKHPFKGAFLPPSNANIDTHTLYMMIHTYRYTYPLPIYIPV